MAFAGQIHILYLISHEYPSIIVCPILSPKWLRQTHRYHHTGSSHTYVYIYIYTHVYITNPFMATCFVNYLIPISLAQMPQFLWVSLISLRMEMTPMMGSHRLPWNVTIHEPCFPTWITISHVCLVTYPGYIVLGCRGVVPPESFFLHANMC